jgi:hypothetical protein
MPEKVKNWRDIPFQQADIEDAAKRTYELDEFLEKLVHLLKDSGHIPKELREQIHECYMKNF